jgi:hypothetical protein
VFICCSGQMFTAPLPISGPISFFHYSGFQPSCHNIKNSPIFSTCKNSLVFLAFSHFSTYFHSCFFLSNLEMYTLQWGVCILLIRFWQYYLCHQSWILIFIAY